MGHPAAKIVKMASQKETDLVIVGSRGLTGIRKFLLGGISQKVVKYSHESVLVVR
jgi:nucleotide-binding universal stress UspA family protein